MAEPEKGQDELDAVTDSPVGREIPPRPPLRESIVPVQEPPTFFDLEAAPNQPLVDKRARKKRKSSSEIKRKRPEKFMERQANTGPRDASQMGIEAEETEPFPPDDVKEAAIRSAPAWLVSLVFHTSMIILLALFYVAQDLPNVLSLEIYSEDRGDQLVDETLQSPLADADELQDPAYSVDIEPVDNPLAAPPELALDPSGLLIPDPTTAPSIGLALTGREKGRKEALLAKYGGTETTEAAVGRALEWLKTQQLREGSWSLRGPYSSSGRVENRTAATAMALLAFQGAGNTHDAGPYKKQVARGWRALLKMQDGEGNFFRNGFRDHRLYSQAQAMIAVCEIYGMTKDSRFRGPAQLAIDYAVKTQAPEGGWRYQPGVDSDTSVTGWFVMGLQSGLMAGLEVPSPTLQRVSEYLNSVAAYGGAFYKYTPIRSEPSVSMTAEGLLCRQYLGWRRDDGRLTEGVDFLLDNPVDWRDRDVYYWYYATQVLHHMEGDQWDRWNIVMRNVIPTNQVQAGKEKGSWSPEGDKWGHEGGRLYMTCLCTYMLEVYYRHLPIYAYRMP